MIQVEQRSSYLQVRQDVEWADKLARPELCRMMMNAGVEYVYEVVSPGRGYAFAKNIEKDGIDVVVDADTGQMYSAQNWPLHVASVKASAQRWGVESRF